MRYAIGARSHKWCLFRSQLDGLPLATSGWRSCAFDHTWTQRAWAWDAGFTSHVIHTATRTRDYPTSCSSLILFSRPCMDRRVWRAREREAHASLPDSRTGAGDARLRRVEKLFGACGCKQARPDPGPAIQRPQPCKGSGSPRLRLGAAPLRQPTRNLRAPDEADTGARPCESQLHGAPCEWHHLCAGYHARRLEGDAALQVCRTAELCWRREYELWRDHGRVTTSKGDGRLD